MVSNPAAMKRLLLSTLLAALSTLPAAAQEQPDKKLGPAGLALIDSPTPPAAWLGVTLGEGGDSGGLIVDSVVDVSPAAAAGIRKGDVLLTFNGQAVNATSELVAAVSALKPGATAAIELRRDKKKLTVNATLKARPGTPTARDAEKRMAEAVEALKEKGVKPPPGLLKHDHPHHPEPSGPAQKQLRSMPPEVELDPFGEPPAGPFLDAPDVQPLLRVEPEWKDGQLHLKWNPPPKGGPDSRLERELKHALEEQHRSATPHDETAPESAKEDRPQKQPEDLIWRKAQAAVAAALEKAGASSQAREAAARALQQAQQDWATRERRRRNLTREAMLIEQEIKRLRQHLEELEKEVREID